MTFYETCDFINKFIKDGCFKFESEENATSDSKEQPPTDDGTENTTLEPSKTEDTSVSDTQPDTEPHKNSEASEPTGDRNGQIKDDVQENTADTVNASDQSHSKQTLNADQIAKKFIECGALKNTVQYAVNSIGDKNKITLEMVKPYIQSAVEKFCQKQFFHTTVSEIAKAIIELTKSIGVGHINGKNKRSLQ